MEQFTQIATSHDLVLIEDACQAHAATIDNKAIGSFGTGCFSFYPTKNMTTGEGGIVTTNQPVIAEKVRLLRSHGQQARYQHTTLGYNLRMTEMQAALGLVQLSKLEQFTEQRIANAHFLTRQLQGLVQTPIARPRHRHVYHQYTIRVPAERDSWAAILQARGIGTAIHYPIPIYRQPFYRNTTLLFRISAPGKAADTSCDLHLPETELAAQQVLSLPVHPALSEENLSTIVKEVLTLCH